MRHSKPDYSLLIGARGVKVGAFWRAVRRRKTKEKSRDAWTMQRAHDILFIKSGQQAAVRGFGVVIAPVLEIWGSGSAPRLFMLLGADKGYSWEVISWEYHSGRIHPLLWRALQRHDMRLALEGGRERLPGLVLGTWLDRTPSARVVAELPPNYRLPAIVAKYCISKPARARDCGYEIEDLKTWAEGDR